MSSRFRKATVTALAAACALLSGCAATPPPPPGPTMDQFRAVADATEALKREKEALDVRVAELEKALKEARREAAGASEAVAYAITEAKRLDLAVQNLDAMYANMLEPRSEPHPQEPPPFRGDVLAADPAMDIYEISVGSKQGVKIADELIVFRVDQFVAIVIVDQVFPDKASVVVKKVNGKPQKRSDIRMGDKVALAQ